MTLVLTLLHLLLLIVLLLPALLVGYLLLLTGAAWLARARGLHRSPLAETPSHRFLFLIPAHNEELLLPATVANLQTLDYPRALYEIHVVADNCSDNTAFVARAGGATVHERVDETLRGKGYALQWLLGRLYAAETPHDGVIILDADSKVSANFLRVMDGRLARGERVVQAYYAVDDPGSAWSVGLRYAALAVLHYLRPLGRALLGGSAGLKGNGMLFAAEVMANHEWTAHLTEDIEFHMGLLLSGQRVTFAADALVEAEMPQTLTGAQTQNVRWERGRIEMARQYVPQLLRAAATGRLGYRFPLLDAAMEHLIPPFSILAAVSAAGFLAAATLFLIAAGGALPALNLGLAAGLLLGQLLYILSGLRLAGAPRAVYAALLRAPFFVVWKLWLYLRVLLGRDRDGWVRTARNSETP